MTDIYEIADQQRRQLLLRERAAATDLVRAYAQAWLRIKASLATITAQIATAEADGTPVDLTWLMETRRLHYLQQQVEAEVSAFSRYANTSITAQQAEAVQAAQQHAHELVRAGLGGDAGLTLGFDRLPTGALESLVGFLSDGSPLASLLDELGPDAGREARSAPINGVALGQGQTAIAAQLRQSLGGNLVRALTISRTEVLRSYREASLRTYRANARVIEGWIWTASLSSRTCGFCISMDGTFHPLDDTMASHPRCRCTPVPKTRTWAELGYPGVPETQVKSRDGSAWFARQDEATQRQILSPGKYAAYASGQITLSDLRGFRRDGRWGPVGYERNLTDALAQKGQ